MDRHIEQEWQFSARDLESTRAWLAAQPRELPGRRFASRPTLTMRDTYYDSPDWTIFRAGFALRVREARQVDERGGSEIEVTLKSLRAGSDGWSRRTEISETVDSAKLDEVIARGEGIGGRIRELVGTRALNPLFQASTRRERQHLLEAETDLPLVEVDLDETLIETPSGGSQELRRVEVECINAQPEAVSAIVEKLRDAAQLEPVGMSKFRAGLAAAGLDPPADADTLTPGMPFADAQRLTLQKYFRIVLSKEADVRSGSVPATHEMRVAARHLEVLLRMFRGFGPTWAVGSRGRVRQLVKRLGAARDVDVQLAFLDTALAGLAPDARTALDPLRERLAARQAQARARLLQALDSPPNRHWTQEWDRNLREHTPGSARARRALTGEVARELVRDAARALRRRATRIDESSSPEDFHEVRIRAKRLRYTVDAFASLYGDAAQSYVHALARLQTVLGDYHDSAVREQRFTQLVTGSPRLPASTSFLVGRLVERDAQAFARCRR
ncbi:MAG TPA: CHAD domain-containing protein, partial [Steroidobacteraceae bacterium]